MTQNSARSVPDLVPAAEPEREDLFASAAAYGVGEIHIKSDPSSQLHAIIAIHSTRLGPATGGCRCRPYPSTAAAIEDALRLARGMSYKAAFASLPCGGGKAVLIRPDRIRNREAYFESFGEFIESLGGRYVTAVDSGTNTADMDIIARRTRHVLSASREKGGSGNPSPCTARGVRMAIEVAVADVLQRNNLEGIHVAIQGAGHVGYALARELHERGAQLTVTDTHSDHMLRCSDEFGARLVSPDLIYDVDCDVFSPCALGAVINDATVKRFNTRIIAGAANNQLQDERHGQLLQQRGILYLPDYVINAGGMIHVLYDNPEQRELQLATMINTLTGLLSRSRKSGVPPFHQADLMAEEILGLAHVD
ncbi:MAG: Glu/Leu/Phe/Val dehydrogenase dimerization domain-containing protein [Pseudomonadota bacterium]